jgi:hypothetical protein
MGTVFYIHRLSKMIDEIVRDLGLTLAISDEKGDIKLTPHLDNIKAMAGSLGVRADVSQQANGAIAVVFSRK